MNVIFLNSLYTLVPQRSIGPYLLKHVLKKRGYSSQVIDFCQEYSPVELLEFVSKFKKEDTMCLALSTTFWFDEGNTFYTYDNGVPPNIYQALKLIKERFPDLKVVMGGAHASYITKRIEHIDAVFIGEAEDTLPELLDHWTKGAAEPPKIVNIFTRKKIYRAPITKTYDIQHCDFQFDDNDCIVEKEVLPLETARGCIFKCKFCAYPHLGKKKFDYLKTNENIKQYFLNNYEKYKTTSYIMLDDTFNDSEYKIDSFLEMTRSLPFKINYAAYIRADLVHRFEGMAEKLQESGLKGAFFGLESLHLKASTIVGKGWSGKSAKEFVPHLVHNVWKNKISAHCGLIVGLPEETADDLKTSLEWANTNMINVIFFGLQVTNNLGDRPYVSEFEKNADKYGFKFDENGKWYSDLWNRQTVLVAADNLNKFRKRMNLSGFNHVSLHTLGFEDDEILKTHPDKMTRDNPEFYKRKKVFMETYLQKLRNL